MSSQKKRKVGKRNASPLIVIIYYLLLFFALPMTELHSIFNRTQVKKMGLMLVAYRSRPEETKAMRDAFLTYDVDLNGRIGRDEFQAVLKQQGYTDDEVWHRRARE